MTAAVTVHERPILMSGPMVRATLDGRKSQTRRVVKLPAWIAARGGSFDQALVDPGLGGGAYLKVPLAGDQTVHRVRSPYGDIGDRLWVRETWAARGKHTDRCTPVEIACNRSHFEIWYHEQCFNGATEKFNTDFLGRWRPSIHMPRALSRITLEITNVRVERLQEIEYEDMRAEGLAICHPLDPTLAFRELWNTINASRGYGWDVNPWVWCLTFKRVTP
jgi:hypothetical protein